VLTFTGNPFLTSEFEITHILFFSLKLRHLYMNRWILICGDSVIGLHVTKTFTNFGEKKPNRFQVIAFCFKRNNKSCYVTHVNFSSSTLFKEVGKCFYWLHRYPFYRIVFNFLFWFRWYQWYFCGINGCEDTNRNVCLYTSFSEGIYSITVRDVIALPCATSIYFWKHPKSPISWFTKSNCIL